MATFANSYEISLELIHRISASCSPHRAAGLRNVPILGKGLSHTPLPYSMLLHGLTKGSRVREHTARSTSDVNVSILSALRRDVELYNMPTGDAAVEAGTAYPRRKFLATAQGLLRGPPALSAALHRANGMTPVPLLIMSCTNGRLTSPAESGAMISPA